MDVFELCKSLELLYVPQITYQNESERGVWVAHSVEGLP